MTNRIPVILAIALATALAVGACAPKAKPVRRKVVAPPTPARRVAPTAPTPRPKRTGLHPELFDVPRVEESPTFTPTTTPTPTPTYDYLAGTPTPTPTLPPPEPPRSESLDPIIATAAAPNVAAALRLIEQGRQALEAGNYEKALGSFERGVAIDPTNTYGYYFLARYHYEQKSYAQAVAFANRAAVLAANDDPTWAGRVYALQGIVFEEVGRYTDARKAYEKALAADPGNATARIGVNRVGGGTPP